MTAQDYVNDIPEDMRGGVLDALAAELNKGAGPHTEDSGDNTPKPKKPPVVA